MVAIREADIEKTSLRSGGAHDLAKAEDTAREKMATDSRTGAHAHGTEIQTAGDSREEGKSADHVAAAAHIEKNVAVKSLPKLEIHESAKGTEKGVEHGGKVEHGKSEPAGKAEHVAQARPSKLVPDHVKATQDEQRPHQFR